MYLLIVRRLAESTTPPGTPPATAVSLAHTAPPKSTLTEQTTSHPLKRRYVSDIHDIEVVKKMKQHEVELRDRNTVLRGVKPNVSVNIAFIPYLYLSCNQNFSSVRMFYADKLKRMREASKAGVTPLSATATPGNYLHFSEMVMLILLFCRSKIASSKSSYVSSSCKGGLELI